MNKFAAVAMSAIVALTMIVQTPTQAHAGSKERALVAGLVVGAAVAAALVSKGSKRGFAKANSYVNDDCGPGYFMKRGQCQLRGQGFSGKTLSGGKLSGQNFKGRNFNGKSFKGGKFATNAKLPDWQLQAIRKGCKRGMGWNKVEGCHEND